MDIKEAVKIIERHNIWRRGGNIKMGDPTVLGDAIDTVVRYIKEEENIKDEVNRIIINFEDLAFKEYFEEAGKSYCKMGNNFLRNFEHTKIKEDFIKGFTDLNYIKAYFTNNIIGNYINNYSENEYWGNMKFSSKIVDVSLFKEIKEHVEYLVSKIKTLTVDEFENILKYNDGSMDDMRLIIEYNNNKFESYIL